MFNMQLFGEFIVEKLSVKRAKVKLKGKLATFHSSFDNSSHSSN